MTLYDARFEHDACGIGMVADVSGAPSRWIVDAMLEGLCGVKHRGAVAADSRSGDGAGVLLPLPTDLFAAEAGQWNGQAGPPARLGVAMCFLDGRDDAAGERAREAARAAVADSLAVQGLRLLGWRRVPVAPEVLGDTARAVLPSIEQALFDCGHVDDDTAERHCYVARKRAEATCREANVRAYFASWSTRTITYKAMSAADQLADFYPDLTDRRLTAWFGIFHQRYSTNTLPTWERAQPFRFLCHNGEINTIEGNVNLMRARHGRLGADWAELHTVSNGQAPGGEGLLEPIIDTSNSDSARLDNALELLIRGGRDVDHALAMLVPQVWEGRRDLRPTVRDFHRYHAALLEPWDGPAGLVFSDGKRVAAALDRNGLRPLRYSVCEDGFVTCASEVGAVSTAGHGSVRRSRLGPGQMLLVDPALAADASTNGRRRLPGLLEDDGIKRRLASRQPYGEWVRAHQRTVTPGQPVGTADEDLLHRQIAAGYTKEEETTVLRPMANDGKEPISSMGDDTAIAVLAERPRTVYHYLKQRFAQVTNPPIDHLREWAVMSLRSQLGPRQSLLTEVPEAARLLELDGFIMYPQGLQDLVLAPKIPFEVAGLDATFPVTDGPEALAHRLRALGEEAVAAVQGGADLLIVSDRAVDSERAPVPSVLAVGAIHHRLVAAGERTQASIIAETDDARETHTFACLLGYGADVICPRLAFESLAELADRGRLGKGGPSAGEAQEDFRHAVEDGVLKIMSKMGISTLDSYRSAQIFEAVGLGREVIDTALVGTPSKVGGIGLAELAAGVLALHAEAFAEQVRLPSPGFYKYKRGGDYHATNPDVVGALHRTVGLEGDLPPLTDEHNVADLRAAHLLQRAMSEGRYERYAEFSRLVNERTPTEPRDLLEPVPAPEPVDLDEVEPVGSIVQRFYTGAMSLGALSPEAHETLAMAMNMLGGSSNCGEGGEDPARFATRGSARDRNSKAKQVASGRFGVTPQYLAYADELQIKIAQGSKPGEGGQLPAHKVSELIARLRHTQPGVALISPPPHHDIYSIEDLAQLIYDLKQVNPFASVSVKLVSCAGVGTVAAGVVKGLADAVQIAGCDGGTGASPLSSIKHAGLPWELGIAETQQTLVRNGLRSRVRVQVDGGFKSGRDVLIAALLGADEYGFGTSALVAEGCIMVRTCHRDTCPVGIASQRRELRDKFEGTPEMVATYLLLVAEEVRRGLAAMGLRNLDEAIGRVDLLRPRDVSDYPRALTLDVTPLLADPFAPDTAGEAGDDIPVEGERDEARCYQGSLPIQAPRSELGDRVFDDAFESIWDGTVLTLKYDVGNADRTVGARLGGAIGLEFGDAAGSAELGRVSVRFTGEAGQSFGAFLSDGVEFVLTGEANDYVGKGMGGGRIVIRPPANDALFAQEPDTSLPAWAQRDAYRPVLLGNTVLYGATGGELYVAGRAGERFAVRNSGVLAVVEGVGEHCCEYMTGGIVVVLGATGANLGAGMTGGECYVLDAGSAILARVNNQLVEARRPDGAQINRLRELVERHVELTGSVVGGALLDDWEAGSAAFWRIAPHTEIARVEAVHEGSVGAPA
ncbi:MAG: glutamate synthase subunit alpha [Nitriliruptorales bacterium]|nr:glutamate synthase subunit alpha [Nitriliruptorales bacterium]